MKSYVISLGYNNCDVMGMGLGRYFKTARADSQLVIVDQHYPIGRDKILKLFEYCKQRGAIILDPGKNLGLNAGWDYACKQLNLQDDDVVIGYDPDSWPVKEGWDLAILESLRDWKESMIPWVSLASSNCYMKETKVGPTLGGHATFQPAHEPCWMQSVCGFVWGPLDAIGNFQGPCEWYGELEKTIHPRYMGIGFDMAWLTDWFDEHDKLAVYEDPLLQQWKVQHALDRSVKVDFETWLKQKGVL